MPTPSPSAVLDDTFGFVVNGAVRRESSLLPIFDLGIGEVGGVVSPDGRRLAYWAKSDLRVIDIAANARPRTLLTVSSPEYALYVAWSNDATGIVVGVNGTPAVPAADAPPAYTALRAVDVAGGQPREIARVANANVVPLAWDRVARLIAAYEPICCGTAHYDTITEDGIVTRAQPELTLFFLKASSSAKFVFGTNMDMGTPCPCATNLLRVWPASSYESGLVLHSVGNQPILAAEWRPNGAEIGVLFDNRLELWSASGLQRSISLPKLPAVASSSPNGTLLFRVDGKAVLIGLPVDRFNAYVMAVDLETAAVEVLNWSGLPQPGTSVYIGP